jgi:hypothetical protein
LGIEAKHSKRERLAKERDDIRAEMLKRLRQNDHLLPRPKEAPKTVENKLQKNVSGGMDALRDESADSDLVSDSIRLSDAMGDVGFKLKVLRYQKLDNTLRQEDGRDVQGRPRQG